MKIEWYCAMCGTTGFKAIKNLDPMPTFEAVILSVPGWIVQHNKPHFDVYCSKKCAK
jgi:hypothetical protein